MRYIRSFAFVEVLQLDEHEYAQDDGQAGHVVAHPREAGRRDDQYARGDGYRHRGVLRLEELDQQEEVEVAGEAQREQDDVLPGGQRGDLQEGVHPRGGAHQDHTDLVADGVGGVCGQPPQQDRNDSEEDARGQAQGVLRGGPFHRDRPSDDSSKNYQIEAALPSREGFPDNRKDDSSGGVPAVGEAEAESHGGEQGCDFEPVVLGLGGEEGHESVLPEDEEQVVGEGDQHRREDELDGRDLFVPRHREVDAEQDRPQQQQ